MKQRSELQLCRNNTMPKKKASEASLRPPDVASLDIDDAKQVGAYAKQVGAYAYVKDGTDKTALVSCAPFGPQQRVPFCANLVWDPGAAVRLDSASTLRRGKRCTRAWAAIAARSTPRPPFLRVSGKRAVTTG